MAESLIEFSNPLQMDNEGSEQNLDLSILNDPAKQVKLTEEVNNESTSEVLDLDQNSNKNETSIENPSVEVNPEKDQVDTIDTDINSDYEGLENFLPQVADNLVKIGLIQYVPETVDAENLDAKGFEETLKANIELSNRKNFDDGAEYERGRIVNKLGGLTKELVSYNLDNPNADESDLRSYLESMLYVQDITNLVPEDNAEKIVKEYYKSTGWSNEEIADKVIELTESDKLVKEATRVKPKLDKQAQTIALEKSQQAQEIREFEDNLQENLHLRTVNVLNTGKINNVPLNKSEADFLYSAIMNNEVHVNLKGKKVEMGFAEALVRQAKYDPNRNLENLMLGLLVIDKGPSIIEKYIAKQTRTKETEKFVKEIKFSSSKKSNVREPRKVKPDEGNGIRFNM